MSMLHMLFNEIKHRKLNFLSGCIAVAIATGALIGAVLVFQAHALYSEQVMETHRKEVAAATSVWQDEIRKAVLQFNAVVLPEGQSLEEWLNTGQGTETMPEEWVDKLAHSRIVSIRHILPTLQKWVEWPEQEMRVLLNGTRGDTLDFHKNPKKPLVQPVPEGSVVLGHEIARRSGLNAGDKTVFMGREYRVHKLHEERGNKDDVTTWLPLADAQQLLDAEGQINAILAQQCMCFSSGGSGLNRVKNDINGVLPDTQVFELGSNKALARVQARTQARKDSAEAMAMAEAEAETIKRRIAGVSGTVIPAILLVAVAWVAIVGYANVRRRRQELAILRAIGAKTVLLMTLFLSRSLLMGLVGAVAGLALGVGAGWVLMQWQTDAVFSRQVIGQLFNTPATLALVLFAAPCLATLAGWVPSFMATQTDPAQILAEE